MLYKLNIGRIHSTEKLLEAYLDGEELEIAEAAQKLVDLVLIAKAGLSRKERLAATRNYRKRMLKYEQIPLPEGLEHRAEIEAGAIDLRVVVASIEALLAEDSTARRAVRESAKDQMRAAFAELIEDDPATNGQPGYVGFAEGAAAVYFAKGGNARSWLNEQRAAGAPAFLYALQFLGQSDAGKVREVARVVAWPSGGPGDGAAASEGELVAVAGAGVEDEVAAEPAL